MIDFNVLTPLEFENLCFDLMQILGLKNCVWRTPGRDGGRDIQGDSFGEDFSGYTRCENWYVECKRYSETVNWPTIWEKIAYAESNCADILLFITSSRLSPQAIDEVNRWNYNKKRPCVRFWNGQELHTRVCLFPQILVKYGISKNPTIDVAVSILPLTKILVKYTNAESSCLVFGKNPAPFNFIIHALSELISAKIEELENTGKLRIVPFVATKDGFLSPNADGLIESLQFDKYTIRALGAIVCCCAKNKDYKAKIVNKKLVINACFDYPEPILNDLQTISFWGAMRVSLCTMNNCIEVEHE